MKAEAPKRAIVLAGGGARGAYEAGVLRFLLGTMPERFGVEPNFEIVCGTSVGAIHACFLAASAHQSGHTRSETLLRIWEDLHVDEVFRFAPGNLFEIPRRIMGLRQVGERLRAGERPDRLYGLLDTGPLERLVVNSIPWRHIRRNLRDGLVESVCVATTQIASGKAVVFVDQHEAELPPWASKSLVRMQKVRLGPVHALASAAIPLLFPAVRVGSRYYADGGLRLNTPLAPALRLGANRVLVISLSQGLSQPVPEHLAQERTAGFGNPMYLFGKVLNALLLSPVDADLARLERFNDLIENGTDAFGPEFLERINQVQMERAPDQRPLQPIESLVVRPSEDLGRIAGKLVSDESGGLELSAFLKFFMRTFQSSPNASESDLLSYLLFDTAYARPLTELGYADAERQQEELAAFFTD